MPVPHTKEGWSQWQGSLYPGTIDPLVALAPSRCDHRIRLWMKDYAKPSPSAWAYFSHKAQGKRQGFSCYISQGSQKEHGQY